MAPSGMATPRPAATPAPAGMRMLSNMKQVSSQAGRVTANFAAILVK